ncbi:tetratricopeptide repeat protein [Streptomyces sp. NPDC059443]|uniref:tetratricopeptide repeat protein n=1 Tax=unclassified Streptomyces TaxID=2593676 RepID=UPI0036BAC89F
MNRPIDLDREMRAAIELRDTEQFEQSCTQFQNLVRRFPDHAELNFQAAWSHDRAGLQKVACGYYEQALKLPDLSKEDRQEAMLGLGSTYRVLGRHEESVAILEQAVREFSETAALRAFLAISYFSAGFQEKALGVLLNVLADTSSDPSVGEYLRPIRQYADEFLAG